jgi:hypothetical protein
LTFLQIYQRIEVSHPVFFTLFCNILIPLASTLVNVFFLPWIPNSLGYATLVVWCNVVSFLYHCCSWEMVTVLRYVYILHPHVVDAHFRNHSRVAFLASGAVFLQAFSCVAALYGIGVAYGWRKVKPSEMLARSRTAYFVALASCYAAPIGISCALTLVLLRKRGKFGDDQVKDRRPMWRGLAWHRQHWSHLWGYV